MHIRTQLISFATLVAFAASADDGVSLVWKIDGKADPSKPNLITNGGFEESSTPLPDSGWDYVNGAKMPTGWAGEGNVVRLNAQGSGSTWNLGNCYLTFEGAYTVGLQREGSVSQTVTVPADGFYELTWKCAKRVPNGAESYDHRVNVLVDGQLVYTFLTTYAYWDPHELGSGAFELTAGEHTVQFAGVNDGVDATTFLDAIAMRECANCEKTLVSADIAAGATYAVDGSDHGIRGVFRALDVSEQNPFYNFGILIHDILAFQTKIRATGILATYTLHADQHETFDVGDHVPGSLPAAFAEGGATPDNWVVEWDSVMTVPESGLYTFRAKPDDAFLFALDRRSVLQSRDCMTTMTTVNLEKGPHAAYIALLDNLAAAKLTIEVKGPGDTDFKGLPLVWFTPANGARALTGAGAVAPNDGAVFTLTTGEPSTFAGSLAGSGTGALVLDEDELGHTGSLSLADVTGGIPYLKRGEMDIMAAGRTLTAVGSEVSGGKILLTGAQGVGLLYGGQKVELGAKVSTQAVTGDVDCGISSDRVYTHLKSFPLDDTAKPIVNGVTFDGRGEMEGTGPAAVFTGSSGWTDYKSLYNNFRYGEAYYSLVLSGLTPGKTYEYRFYFLAFGSGGRTGKIRFSGQDGVGNGVFFGEFAGDFDTVFGNVAQESSGYISCRYVAGADGKLVVEVLSDSASDTVHCYACLNEELGGSEPTAGAVTLAPSAGTRALLTGELAGSDKVSVEGEGEQVIGGIVTLQKSLDVKGKLILTRGADVRTDVNLCDGTLAIRGGAQLYGLSGTGTLDFQYGDPRPYGAVGASGGFDSLPAFRVTPFTCDADSGVSPTKTYLAAFNYGPFTAHTLPGYEFVNEVGFLPLAPQAADPVNGFDFRAGRIRVAGVPESTHEGNPETIGLPETEGMGRILKSLVYAAGMGGQDKYVTLEGLTAGQTYELRFWERLWDAASVETRRVRFSFYTDEANKVAEEHEVAIDREGQTGPYYIAVRFTAQSQNYTVVTRSLDESDTWHLYAASLELVSGNEGDRRYLNFGSDTKFVGTVRGCGFVEKRGAGALTLSGSDVNANGFWFVTGGGLYLDDPAATLGAVAVATGGSFGGTGRVTDDLGVEPNATLVVGSEKGGSLVVGGTLAIGEGASVAFIGDGGLSAKAICLPKSLTIRTDTVSRVKLFNSETPIEGLDVSAWQLVHADGTPDNRFHISTNGKTVTLSRGGLVVIVK